MRGIHAVLLAGLGCGGAREPAATPDAPAAPDAACRASDPASFEACTGKRTTIDGTVATDVMAHPIAGEGPQGYVNVDGVGQIVTGGAKIDCAGPVTVEGVLERVDLGGAEGTPESYEGWAVTGARVTCR